MQETNHDLPNSSHLIRQCRASHISNGLPTPDAFMLRDVDDYLSFNWLEKICSDSGLPVDHQKALRELEKSPPLRPGSNQLWAILKCREIREAISKAANELPDIFWAPGPRNPSHVGVKFPKLHKLVVANELLKRVTNANLFPVRKP